MQFAALWHWYLALCTDIYIWMSLCELCFYPRSVVKNKPPRKASAKNLGTFMPICSFSWIFISFVYIYIYIYIYVVEYSVKYFITTRQYCVNVMCNC